MNSWLRRTSISDGTAVANISLLTKKLNGTNKFVGLQTFFVTLHRGSESQAVALPVTKNGDSQCTNQRLTCAHETHDDCKGT